MNRIEEINEDLEKVIGDSQYAKHTVSPSTDEIRLKMKLDNIYKDIDIQKILRMKLNLQFPHTFQKNEIFNTPHYDDANTSDLKIMIFYLNTCDAHTYFFRGKKVHKKVKVEENTLVCFDGTTLHAGSNPKKTQYKLCLNINYI